MNNISSGWYKIHRPRTIDDYIFQNDFEKKRIHEYIEKQDIPDLLLSGHRGTGKTTLGLILKDALNIEDVDFLLLNASDNNSVDVIRSLVRGFIDNLSISKFKLVFFDEADALTPQAQDALKSMMEDESRNARFIFTCNKPHKLTPEIRSRCTEYTFNALKREHMKAEGLKILLDQGMSSDVDIKALNAVLDAHLDAAYPDFRKFITSLEKHFDNNELLSPVTSDDDIELMVEFIVHIEAGDWLSARDLIYEKLPSDEIENLYRFLDDNLSQIERFKGNTLLLGKAYAILGCYMEKHNNVSIPELNLTVCLIKLCEI